jgi:hypothetical protein
MNAAACWVSHPHEWQPLLDRWQREHPDRTRLHAWEQLGGAKVRGLTLGDDGRDRPVRVVVAVPHAHEPAPTAAIVNLASALLTGKLLDGSRADAGLRDLTDRCLLTLLPDTNSQGRARSPRRVWEGDLDNEEFLKHAFGEAAEGNRFGRYPEWRFAEHRPRRVGVVYEEVAPGEWVESNTSRRSAHTRALDAIYKEYRPAYYLDMHQHEGDEACLLPAEYDDLPGGIRTEIDAWAKAVLDAWAAAGIPHKGSYVPYRGQPRQQFFRDYWAGRCPGMRKLTTESRNNRHSHTGEPTSLERQFRSAWIALTAALRHLAG